MSSADSDADFIAQAMPAFISEAVEQTEAIESLLLQLEENPSERELLDSLFRCAHTVKGSAGIFGLSKVVEFTHHVETLLDQMRDGVTALTPELSTLLLQCNDQIKFLVATANNEGADTPEERDTRAALVAQLRAVTEGSGTASQSVAPVASAVAPSAGAGWCIQAIFGPELFRNGMDALSIARYLGGMGTVRAMRAHTERVPALTQMDAETCYLGFAMELDTQASRADIEGAFSFVMDDCQLDVQPLGLPLAPAPEPEPESSVTAATLLPTQAVAAPENAISVPSKPTKTRDAGVVDEGRYIRVQADRLDAVINLLGELVIAGAGASLLARQKQQTELTEATLHMNRLIEEVRNGTLGLRMVPVGETFSRFRRVVRDTASTLGKEVNFEIIGGDAELDKSMVEKIADPLMHLVRNSLDHGLEPPDERMAAGKNRVGTLKLIAQHETGAILIRIEDDGRGINRERVLQRAWSRGLVEPGVTPSDDAINMLIFEPGFSTAEQVTNLSGRGVGMDVVRRNIESLRGSLKLHSIPGVGLQVDIRLPLTLAIIDSFMVAVGKTKFVLPLEAVVEVIEAADDKVKVDELGRHCLELRGAVLPTVRLRQLYALESSDPDRVSVVVVHSHEGKFGIEVEALLGQQQTVIKPLGRLFKAIRGISGTSILGNGEVALILDTNALARLTSSEAETVAV